jgi:tRNA threonylcarbamoyladenosine modification (KEOPS) complex Cgi121 subunit
LLKYIDEFHRYLAIVGLKEAEVKNTEEFLQIVHKEKSVNVENQFFDAKLVATWQHLYFALLNALTAFKNGENISKNLAMETMLYASAQHQIRKATEMLGIKPNTTEIAMLLIGESSRSVESALAKVLRRIKAEQDDRVLGLTKEKSSIIQKAFGITDLELETAVKKGNLEKALVDLVIERVALLATQS